jgi:hypothetical protein
MPQSMERRCALLFAFAWLVTAGCDKIKPISPFANRRPSVEFTHAPISTSPADPSFYAYRVYWSGDDPDGRVERFEYCIDPTPTDSVWVRTERSEELIFFSATTPDSKPGPVRHATSPHVLVLRAIDNQGAISAFKTRAFYSYTVAPSVQIRSPAPSGIIEAEVVPSVIIRWEGQDPDGQFHDRPVSYRYLKVPVDKDSEIFRSDPDSLRRRDAPHGFANWDSTGGDSAFVRLTDLTPGSRYLFAVVAFDEAGAYSPVFSLFENILQMYVTVSAMGPRIHVFNEFIDFTYDSGGYTVDPLRWIRVEAPHGSPITFHWDAIPSPGSAIESYRWALDLIRIDDPAPRSDEETDVRRWSRPSPLTRSCTLRGLSVGQHLLYIEAKDNNDLASLAVVEITVVAATLEYELLVVDDTRREVDKFPPSGLDFYKDPWPSATELDTFLFARGGFPWRQTQEPRTGVVSGPGVLAGYPYDTLGTRMGYEVPTFAAKLATLARYRHVVWMVDRVAATYETEVLGLRPMPALRYMSSRGHASTLGAYLRAGGRVWLVGGGAGTASMGDFNSSRNDDTRGEIYSEREGELGPGRLMWDGAHWRSAFTAENVGVTIGRSGRAEAIAAAPWTHDDRWTAAPLTAPDYRRLPASLAYRDPASDPLPPTRRSHQGNLYYRSTTTCEYLIEPNFIRENVDLSGAAYREASVLDTILEARSILLRVDPAPVMTWYHGRDVNRFVFTGFAPWDFRRADCIAVVDFVLQDLWGIRRLGVDRGLRAAPAIRGTPGVRTSPARSRSVSAPVSRERPANMRK